VPLSASLSLDVSKFEQGLKKAEVELQTFERATKSTNRDLKRLMEEFSGQKVVVEAARMSEAVTRIGGASKLTEGEQRRVNASVTEAIAKYRALGQEAPAHLVKLQAETAKVERASISAGSSIARMAASFTVAGLAESAIRGMANGLGDFVSRGGEVSGMRNAFDKLSGGVDAANIRIGAIRKSTLGLVDDFSAMQASNKATLLGLGLGAEQMGELAKTASILGRAMGQDATKSLDDLITALGRSSPMILDNLGLTVKVGEANDRYAASLGRTADSLSDAEKKQAFMNAAMDAAKDKVDTLGALTLTASDRLSQMRTSVKNVSDATASWAVSIGPVNAGLELLVDRMRLTEELFRGGPRKALEEYKRQLGETIPTVKALEGNWRGLHAPAGALTISTEEMAAATKKLTEKFDANVKSAEAFNAQLQSFGGGAAITKANELVRVLGAMGGPLKVLPSQLETMAKAMRDASEAALLMGRHDLAQQYAALARTLTPVVQLQQRYNVTIGQFVMKSDDYSQAVRDQIDVLTKLDDTLSFGVLPNIGKLAQAWAPLKAAVDATNPRMLTSTSRLDALAQSSAQTATALRSLSGALAEMAQISGKANSGLGALATVVASLSTGQQAASGFATALGGMRDGSIKTGAGLIQMAASVTTLVAALNQATSSSSRAQNALSGLAMGASAGATIGTAFGPAGTGIGAVIGGAIGGLVGLFGGAKKKASEVGAVVTDWSRLIAGATDETGRLSRAMRDTLSTMLKMGTATKEIRDYLKGQGAAALDGFNAVAAGVERWGQYGDAVKKAQEAVDKARAAGDDTAPTGSGRLAEYLRLQDELTNALREQQRVSVGAKAPLADLAIQATAAFNAAISAGMSYTEALKKVQPGIQAVIKAHKDLGLSILDPAMAALALQSNLLASHPEILAGIDGIAQGMLALSNMGLLNEETFASMQRTALDMYTRIQGEVAKAGGSTRDALLPMQRYLQEAAAAAKELGIPLDENTQMMIDQSRALGIWKDKAVDPMLEVRDAALEIRDAIRELIAEMKRIPSRVSTEINTRYTRDGEPSSGGGGGTSGGAGGTSGGGGTGGGDNGSRGFVAPSDPRITGGVSPSSGGATTITVPVYIDGRQVAEATVPHIPDALNRRGVRQATWP